jgi:hypothetical protein
MSKKSNYRTFAEGIVFNKLKDFEVPTPHVSEHRKLTVDEIKEYIKEEFGKAKKAADVKAKELDRGWGDAELENEIEWAKKLKLKEFVDNDVETEEE